jgi:Fur family ferric uptake transcriptional regulator
MRDYQIKNRLHFEFIRRHIKWTRPRDQVYQTLYHAGPCTISELIASIKSQVSQRTIYNTINLLVGESIARRFWQSGRELFEITSPYKQDHHHFYCEKCGHVMDFNDEQIETAIAAFGKRRRLQLTGHQLELSGFCSACAQTP